MNTIDYEKVTHIGAMDPPRLLSAGDKLSSEHFIVWPISYGRVLFTEQSHAVECRCCAGDEIIYVSDCLFEFR